MSRRRKPWVVFIGHGPLGELQGAHLWPVDLARAERVRRQVARVRRRTERRQR